MGYQHQLDDLYTRTSALIIQISNIQRTQNSSVQYVPQLKRPFKTLTPPSGVFFQAQVIRVPTVICHLRSILLKELLVTFYSLLRDSMGPPLREKWYSGPQKSKPLHFHGLLDKIKTANMTDFRIISKKKTQDQEKLNFCSFAAVFSLQFPTNYLADSRSSILCYVQIVALLQVYFSLESEIAKMKYFVCFPCAGS